MKSDHYGRSYVEKHGKSSDLKRFFAFPDYDRSDHSRLPPNRAEN